MTRSEKKQPETKENRGSQAERQVSRRQLLKTGVGLIGAGLTIGDAAISASERPSAASAAAASAASENESVIGMKFEPRETVRVGIIGVGGRGTGMLANFLGVEHVQVNAICDLVKEKAAHAQELVEKAGGKRPTLYTANDHDYENLCKRDDLDFIYIATPWDWHAPMAIAAMTAGKHAGVEVPAVNTLEECQALVDTSEKTRRHCLIMENCCYGFNELMVLNMIRGGVLGELVHGEAAYIHDLRGEIFSDKGEGLWRRAPHTARNGNLYPTHGLGPVANYMGINRGDRFDYLVSMSSQQKGFEAYRAAKVPKDSPKWNEKYICGDMNTSLIKTVNGLTIMLQHDVSNARPYDRINLISGVKGVFRDYPERIFVDGQSGEEAFTSIEPYKQKYAHKLWKEQGENAEGRGHGGMDYILVYRLMQCMREGLEPDIDVYDAAAWTAPAPLSQQSVAQGSAPVKFPDFTRGKWKQRNGAAL
jgi:F0F1-type ATP synthase membrane subunit c/vacuolar-type H+-ATPase subunit K